MMIKINSLLWYMPGMAEGLWAYSTSDDAHTCKHGQLF